MFTRAAGCPTPIIYFPKFHCGTRRLQSRSGRSAGGLMRGDTRYKLNAAPTCFCVMDGDTARYGTARHSTSEGAVKTRARQTLSLHRATAPECHWQSSDLACRGHATNSTVVEVTVALITTIRSTRLTHLPMKATYLLHVAFGHQ